MDFEDSPNMLKSRHQLGVEAAQGVAGQESRASLLEMLIYIAQLV